MARVCDKCGKKLGYKSQVIELTCVDIEYTYTEDMFTTRGIEHEQMDVCSECVVKSIVEANKGLVADQIIKGAINSKIMDLFISGSDVGSIGRRVREKYGFKDVADMKLTDFLDYMEMQDLIEYIYRCDTNRNNRIKRKLERINK